MMSSGKPIRNMPGSLDAAARAGHGRHSNAWSRVVDTGSPRKNIEAIGSAACGKHSARSDLGLRLEHLPAAIHAGLEVDVVRTAQLARILVLDIGGRLERVGGAAHAAARRRSLFPWHGHGIVLLELFRGA